MSENAKPIERAFPSKGPDWLNASGEFNFYKIREITEMMEKSIRDSNSALDSHALRRFQTLALAVEGEQRRMSEIVSPASGDYTAGEADYYRSLSLAVEDIARVKDLLRSRRQLNPWPMP